MTGRILFHKAFDLYLEPLDVMVRLKLYEAFRALDALDRLKTVMLHGY